MPLIIPGACFSLLPHAVRCWLLIYESHSTQTIWYRYHASLSSEQRREFLHNLMRSGSNMAAMNTKRDWKPAAVICGYPVCFKAISIIYNISTATIATAVKSAKAIPHDTALLAHGNKVSPPSYRYINSYDINCYDSDMPYPMGDYPLAATTCMEVHEYLASDTMNSCAFFTATTCTEV